MHYTCKGKAIVVAGQPAIGDRFHPGYMLTDSATGDLIPSASFESFTGLFYFAPSLDTPICALSTKKLSEMAKKYPQYKFYILTADTPMAQKRVCLQEKIEADNLTNIRVLSTISAPAFLVAHGLRVESQPLKGLSIRALFVLSEGEVVHVDTPSDLATEPNYESAESALRKIGR